MFNKLKIQWNHMEAWKHGCVKIRTLQKLKGNTKSNSALPHQHWSKNTWTSVSSLGTGHDQGFSFKLSGWCDIHTKSASDQIKEGYQQKPVCGLAWRAVSHWMITSVGRNWEGFFVFCILSHSGFQNQARIGILQLYCDGTLGPFPKVKSQTGSALALLIWTES